MRRALLPLGAVLVLGATATLALRDAWPWPRLLTAPAIVVDRAYREVQDTLRRGETLTDLLSRQGIQGFDLVSVARSLGFEPRRLKAGLVFNFRHDLAEPGASGVMVRTGPEERYRFYLADLGWNGAREAITWRPELVRLEGNIDHSLYVALDEAVPDSVFASPERIRLAWDFADVYAWNIDFTRDIQPGDHFTVVVERLVSEEGEQRFGRVLASELRASGKVLSAFRFPDRDGRSSFYDVDANSLKRAFLRAPVEFRRISSSFSSARRHPILGITRRHSGTDYAADPGTPVMAAGDGAVQTAGWSSGYGNLVELRHRNGVTTRYGHLKRFASGIRRGSIVTQGQVIGYVGSTGLANGPHLHYEFRMNGVAQDSRRINLGQGKPIEEAVRHAFLAERDRLAAFLSGAVSLPVPSVPQPVIAGTSAAVLGTE